MASLSVDIPSMPTTDQSFESRRPKEFFISGVGGVPHLWVRLVDHSVSIAAVLEEPATREIETYYTRVLENTPGAIPGWMLEPGAVRRSFEDTLAAHTRLANEFSIDDFLQCCSVSVPELERAWAKKKGLATAKARGEFSRAALEKEEPLTVDILRAVSYQVQLECGDGDYLDSGKHRWVGRQPED